MGKYLLQRNLLTENGELSRGQTVDLDDSDPKTARLLEKGTVVQFEEGMEVPSTPSAFEAAQAETAEKNAAALKLHNEQQAREAEVRAEEEAKRAGTATVEQEAPTTPAPLEVASDSSSAPQEVTPVEEPPVPTTQETPVQPTIAEIEATLAASESDSDSSKDIQIS